MPKNHLVTFGIDGLYDTHSLYRIGTNFDTIIKNAKMFINNGGNACWTFIIFKHNEHQVELAEQLAKTTGFKTFQAKQTSRFLINPYLDVVNKKGKTTHRLEFPTESKLTFIDKKTLTNFQSLTSSVEVSCQVEQTNSVYIDVYGQVWPCCFIASTPYQYTELDSPTLGFVNASKQSLNEVVNKLGGIEKLNIKTQSIKDIVNSEKWQTVWDDGFKGPNKLHMCARTCGNF
jgi:sulfatase maturation enzyme AslB (radical SAM superfamily)